MNKVILMFVCFLLCTACQSQKKTDLEKIDFSKNYKEIFKNVKFQTDQQEIATTLPIAYTKNVSLYQFGTVVLQNSTEEAIKSSTVGILINNITERQTKGIKIEIEDTSVGNNMFNYLKSQYKAPKILSGIPAKNKEGKILGNAAYQWDLKDKTILFVQYYEYTNNMANISSVLYLVDNKVPTPGSQETAVSRLIKTYTP